MGFFDYVADLYSALSVTEVEAEERQQFPGGQLDQSGEQSNEKDANAGGMGTAQHRDGGLRGGASNKTPADGTNEESDEEADVNASDAERANARTTSSSEGQSASRGEKVKPEGADDEPEEEAEEEEEEEEEEEDEPSDPKPKLEAECLQSSCKSVKHHYDECAERVQKQIDDNGKPEEDCIEEYFHMMHCATQCSSAKLFKILK